MSIADFKLFLVGDPSRNIPGLLDDKLDAIGKNEICDDTCRRYANHLGYFYTKT